MDASRIFTSIAYVGVFVISGLSNSVLGRNTRELSDLYPTLITPAGYAFSIWGLIYAFFAVFAIYQLLPRAKDDHMVESIGAYPSLLAITLILWLVVWGNQSDNLLAASLFVILFSLFCTAMIQHKLGRPVLCGYFQVRFGFSLCLGWLLVASMINLFAAFRIFPRADLSIDVVRGLSFAGIALILPLTIIILAVTRDPAPAITICWGLIGIFVKQTDQMDIAIFALVIACVVAACGLLTLWVWIKHKADYRDLHQSRHDIEERPQK